MPQILCTLTRVDADGLVGTDHELYAQTSNPGNLLLRSTTSFALQYLTPQHLYVTSHRPIEKGDYFLSFNDDESYLEVEQNMYRNFATDYADERWTAKCRRLEMSTNPHHDVPAPSPALLAEYARVGGRMETLLVELDEDGYVDSLAYTPPPLPPPYQPSPEEKAADDYVNNQFFQDGGHRSGSETDIFLAGIQWERERIRKLVEQDV